MSEVTLKEAGSYLVAVGTVMRNHNLSAGAVADDGYSNENLIELMVKQGIDQERAAQLLKRLSPEEAILLPF